MTDLMMVPKKEIGAQAAPHVLLYLFTHMALALLCPLPQPCLISLRAVCRNAVRNEMNRISSPKNEGNANNIRANSLISAAPMSLFLKSGNDAAMVSAATAKGTSSPSFPMSLMPAMAAKARIRSTFLTLPLKMSLIPPMERQIQSTSSLRNAVSDKAFPPRRSKNKNNCETAYRKY